tara:strand:+ start:5932 stop:6153 length:222 start_codon:yes stop_codon:yes gene_type:complete
MVKIVFIFLFVYDVKLPPTTSSNEFPSPNDTFLSVNIFFSGKVFFIVDERFLGQKQHTERMCISSIITLVGYL